MPTQKWQLYNFEYPSNSAEEKPTFETKKRFKILINDALRRKIFFFAITTIFGSYARFKILVRKTKHKPLKYKEILKPTKAKKPHRSPASYCNQRNSASSQEINKHLPDKFFSDFNTLEKSATFRKISLQ